jgi:hypothetical protein
LDLALDVVKIRLECAWCGRTSSTYVALVYESVVYAYTLDNREPIGRSRYNELHQLGPELLSFVRKIASLVEVGPSNMLSAKISHVMVSCIKACCDPCKGALPNQT